MRRRPTSFANASWTSPVEPQLAVRDLVELGVHQRSEFVQGDLITCPVGMQEIGDARWFRRL